MITVIVDKIGEVVESMRNLSVKEAAKYGLEAGKDYPFYFYGHPIDVNKQLIIRDKDKVFKHQKYPAIVLRLPTTEEFDGGLVKYNMNIAIFAETTVDADTPDRYRDVIKPILNPLYELFIDRLVKSSFVWDSPRRFPPHTKIDQPYYGVTETQGNKAHIFTNPLDAIELVNLKINSTFKRC